MQPRRSLHDPARHFYGRNGPPKPREPEPTRRRDALKARRTPMGMPPIGSSAGSATPAYAMLRRHSQLDARFERRPIIGLAVPRACVFVLIAGFALAAAGPAAAVDSREWLRLTTASLDTCAVTDPRCAKALQFLKAGKPADAEPLLLAVAQEAAKSGNAQGAASAYRTWPSSSAIPTPGGRGTIWPRRRGSIPSICSGRF
jgi:hypothetical protein